MPITEPIDEDELEADLAALEQENLDEKMLKTGTMPVADSLNRLPKAANGERKRSHASSMAKLRKTYLADEVVRMQSKANRKRRWKKRTRRRSCGSCRLKWPCERQTQEDKNGGNQMFVRLL